MSDNRATLEVIAPTIEEAVENGLRELGLPREAVEVEILDEGSRGLFGLGTRQARVRLSIKSAAEEVAEQPEVVSPPAIEDEEPFQPTQDEPIAEVSDKVDETPAEVSPEIDQVAAGSREELMLEITQGTVEELLDMMKVKAQVSTYFGERDDPRRRIPIRVDIEGNDLSILIGRHAETLNALQYLTALIVGKELGRAVTVIVDVEGYRQRRERQVRHLARRMAEQAISTGRRQVLEPMPANERRFVHIELRDNDLVKTESIGEEPRRKVTIIPL
ncbi:MAG: RNA-binding cell elongation regulator Jag/EloR [Anaerolineales bacterium]|jgi:spoIIIJ-associated protein